jgi:hypothetical protein
MKIMLTKKQAEEIIFRLSESCRITQSLRCTPEHCNQCKLAFLETHDYIISEVNKQ